jgi:hypothetical protein
VYHTHFNVLKLCNQSAHRFCVSYGKGTGKVDLCLTNKALRHEGLRGSGCIHPHFLDLGTNWRWVVSFTLLPLYTWGKSPRYPQDRKLDEPLSRSGWRGENSWPYRDSNTNVQPVASRYTDYAIPAPFFRMVLTVNSVCFRKQHQLTDPCRWDNVFPVRFELNFYIIRRNLVLKWYNKIIFACC